MQRDDKNKPNDGGTRVQSKLMFQPTVRPPCRAVDDGSRTAPIGGSAAWSMTERFDFDGLIAAR